MMLLACRILTDQHDIVAFAINGQVAGFGQSFHHTDLFRCDREHTWMSDLTDDRNAVAAHADGNNGILCTCQVRLDFALDQVLTLRLGQTADVYLSDYGKIDETGIVHQIALQRAAAGADLLAAAQLVAHLQIGKGTAASGSVVFTVIVNSSFGMIRASYKPREAARLTESIFV